MHPSISQPGSQLGRTTHGLQLGCPLCPKFTTTREKTILKHLDAHIQNAVHFQDKIICRCNQPCRGTGHYHCPYCANTIMRKEDLTIHVTGCQKPLVLPPSLPSSAEISPSVPSSSVGLESVMSVDHSYTLPPSASVESVDPSDTLLPSASVESVDPSFTRPPSTSVESVELPSSRVTNLKLVKCPHCSVVLYKKNLLVHIERKHARPKDITAASHLQSVCVDQTRGLFAIPKGTHGFSGPIHVQRKTWYLEVPLHYLMTTTAKMAKSAREARRSVVS